MLIVKVYVNDRQIGRATALRTQGSTDNDSINVYEVNQGETFVQHRYGDGAAKLAQKILEFMKCTD